MNVETGRELRPALFVIGAQLLALAASVTFIHVHDRATGAAHLEATEVKLQIAASR